MNEPQPRIVPFHRVPIDEDDVAAVVEVLRSGWLSSGPKVRAFEEEFASFVGAEHAVALNSGTAALHLALEALGIGPGDEVIVPTYTFTATGEVARYLGATPVLADVDATTLMLTAMEAERRATPRTRAVMPVHVAGAGWDIRPLLALARDRGWHVVEDAAHALPTTCDAGVVGSFATASAFSFYATKTLTTGEGGMLTTPDGGVAERARLMALHGMSRTAYDRYRVLGRWYYEVEDFGFKYNMPDLSAALGLSQLRRVVERREERLRIATRYDTAFALHPELIAPYRAGGSADSWHLYILRLDLDRLDCDRARFVDELAEAGVAASVHFIPLHLHPAYRELLDVAEGDFPVAEGAYRRALSLPIWPGMADEDVDAVVHAVVGTVERHRR